MPTTLRKAMAAESPGRTVAIIGAGFSGALLTLHLLKRCGPEDRVLLIEKNPHFGLGLAYSTGNSNHLLNVRASNMSAFADRPEHFVQWLRDLPPDLADGSQEQPGPNSFVPRGLYGRYIQQLLGDGIWRQGNDSNVFLVSDEAVALHRRQNEADGTSAHGWDVELAVGRRLSVDCAVLAIGNFPPARGQPGIFKDPWDPTALDKLDPQAPVLLIGTGLTMVDTVISLLDAGHHGPIHAISRRGLLPRMHGAVAQPWHFAAPPQVRTLSKLLREIRTTIREARQVGVDWRAVIDGLRPHTQRLWLDMPMAERRRFLRHLRPWWDVHRHRAAPRIHARIEDAIRRGQLTITPARLGQINPCIGLVEVELAQKSGHTGKITVERVIDCSGLQGDFTKLDRPLVRQLLADGHIRPDQLRLSIDTDITGAVITANGDISEDLYAIGPITKGTFWEIIAVPDIRRSCEQLAAQIYQQASFEHVTNPPAKASASV
ncbi:MAG TPA: FAD/NAD(P)-binding protein [Terriglobia bacterium]|nr:FAD/NAD(P)-binding protein [Terriglobia bacterium]